MKKILFSFIFILVGLFVSTVTVFAASTMLYNNIPNPIPGNVPSVGYEATSTSEFGGQVQLADTVRSNPIVTVLMSSWACQSGGWSTGDCITTPGATFTHPITLNVYNVDAGNSVGSLIVAKTETFTMPYRPSPSGSCTDGKWSDGTSCYNGMAFPISFDLTGTTLPDKVIIGVAYNTAHYGANPRGVTGPYDSLNVGTYSTPSVGTALPTVNDAYLNSSWGGAYCDLGSSGTGSFRLDAGCWGGYLPAFKVEVAESVAPSKVDICHLENKKSTNFHLISVSENAVAAHLKHGDALQGELNPAQLTVVVTYSGLWSYTANFVRTGTVLTGSLTDSYAPITGPIINGSINGNHVVFSFDYGSGSVQGVRTYEGDIQPSGNLTGLWSQTGSQSTGEKFAFTIAGFATKSFCE